MWLPSFHEKESYPRRDWVWSYDSVQDHLLDHKHSGIFDPYPVYCDSVCSEFNEGTTWDNCGLQCVDLDMSQWSDERETIWDLCDYGGVSSSLELATHRLTSACFRFAAVQVVFVASDKSWTVQCAAVVGDRNLRHFEGGMEFHPFTWPFSYEMTRSNV